MTVFGRGYLWPDAAGTATDPTTAFVASTVEVQPLDEALDVTVTVTGAACRALQILVEVASDGTTYQDWCRKTIQGTGIGSYVLTLPVQRASLHRISVLRHGGTAATRVVLSGVTRALLTRPALDGQPLELAYHQAAGLECWGDGAGGAAAMAAGPGAHVPAPAAAAAQQWYPVGEADTAVVDFTVGAVAPTTVELEIRELLDGVNTVEQAAVNNVAAGVISQQIAQEQIVFGALGTRRTREIAVRPGSAVLVMAQYTGGAGGTTGYGLIRFYKIGRY